MHSEFAISAILSKQKTTKLEAKLLSLVTFILFLYILNFTSVLTYFENISVELMRTNLILPKTFFFSRTKLLSKSL